MEVQTEPESYQAVRAIREVCPGFDFHDVRGHDAGDGVSIAQYVILGTLPDGSALRAPGVLVAYSVDGRITRLQEYLDTGQFALLTPARLRPGRATAADTGRAPAADTGRASAGRQRDRSGGLTTGPVRRAAPGSAAQRGRGGRWTAGNARP